jgi:hypothetical protein
VSSPGCHVEVMTSGDCGRNVADMRGTPPVTSPLRGLVQRLQDWPVASQQQARRNAMVAATACAQRRAERDDVADYLHARTAPAAPDDAAGTGPARAADIRTSGA